MRTVSSIALSWLLLTRSATVAAQPSPAAPAPALKVTVLSTMLAGDVDRGVGEWGFAALLDVDGQRLLIDTGQRPETVLRNATELGIDLSTVTDVVMTHNHGDHTAGLVTLRRELSRKNPRALSRVHVGKGIFLRRHNSEGRDTNGLLPFRASYEALGGTFVEHDGPTRLLPGVWLTGPVPRVHPERNFGGGLRLATPAGEVEDTVPEDSSVLVESPNGLVVISGCGHAGIINTLEYARSAIVKGATVHAVIGGFHLFAATDDQLSWTADKLRQFGLRHMLGAHCTGIEAVFRIRQLAGLTRQTAVVGAVGSSFTLGTGINALALAR